MGKIDHGRKISQFIIDSPEFFKLKKTNGQFQIYCDDPPDRPFASDATKYAFFSRAVAEGIRVNTFGQIDCIHLHDWHAAFLLILRQFHNDYSFLKKLRTVFTIHNLSIQGVRPFRHSESSLESWYPDLKNYERSILADPKWKDCINPMAAGIRLSDKVHTVSPSYADEIIKKSDKPAYYGGEGLEMDLADARKQRRLFGILNGSNYPERSGSNKVNNNELIDILKSEVLSWITSQTSVSSAHFLAHSRLSVLSQNNAEKWIILTSVSRVVEQKFFLFTAKGRSHASALDGILDGIKGKGVYILLGTGDPVYEKFFIDMSCKFENFVFLNGYSEKAANALYASGNLFLMPSSYEPCGISQMLAMKEGQPCLVHETGGLKDTVKNNKNGFAFNGKSVEEKVDNLVQRSLDALEIKHNKPAIWNKISKAAFEERFLWDDTVKQYIKKLYT
jgi:starch synthase